jgi:hypothetical protein
MRGWIAFLSAAEVVERQLNLSWNEALRLLLEAYENGELRTQGDRFPDVSEISLMDWFNGERKPPPRGKVPLIQKLLAKKFSNKEIPSDYPRQTLIRECCKADPNLGGSFDYDTLKKAIKKHNAEVRNSPIRTTSE